MTGGSAPLAPEQPVAPKHPAKFSAEILAAIEGILLSRNGVSTGGTILDPFGGVGGVHQLQSQSYYTYAIELEAEWAAQSMAHGWTWAGDFFEFTPNTESCLFWRTDDGPECDVSPADFDAVVTSCTYGNRMADHHNATERCKACKGRGTVPATGRGSDGYERCEKCDGVGRRNHTRLTYRHNLGRDLTDNNSGAMQWGDEYRAFHARAWRKVHGLLVPGGLFVLNVKDHVRDKRLQRVPEWHRDRALKLGFELVEDRLVPVKGMGFGANQHESKVDYEHVYVFRKPGAPPLSTPGGGAS